MTKSLFEELSGRLNAYLVDVDRQAQERSHRLIEGMKQAQGIERPLYKKRRMVGGIVMPEKT